MSYLYDNVLDYFKFVFDIGDRWGKISDKFWNLFDTLKEVYVKGDYGDMVCCLWYVYEVYVMEDEFIDEEYWEVYLNNVIDVGFVIMLVFIAFGTNVVLSLYFWIMFCILVYDFLDGCGYEIFKKEVFDLFCCL